MELRNNKEFIPWKIKYYIYVILFLFSLYKKNCSYISKNVKRMYFFEKILVDFYFFL